MELSAPSIDGVNARPRAAARRPLMGRVLASALMSVVLMGGVSHPAMAGEPTDLRARFDKKWQTEEQYRRASRELWAAYKSADTEYRKLRAAGQKVGLPGDSESASEWATRETANQIAGYLAGEIAEVVGDKVVGGILKVHQIIEIIRWAEADAKMYTAAVKQLVVEARRLKPAVQKFERAQGARRAANNALHDANPPENKRLRMDSPVGFEVAEWDGTIRGSGGTPGNSIVPYLFTNQLYKQDAATVGKSGSWTSKCYPTSGVENLCFAIEVDKRGRVIGYSGLARILKDWRKPRKKEPTTCRRCDGDGEQQCTTCSGRGRTSARCGDCRGSGSSNCERCDGRGKRDCGKCDGDGTTRCGTCNGKGFRRVGKKGKKRKVPCNACSEEGQVTCPRCDGDRQRECKQCDGGGTNSCTACGGDGSRAATCSDCRGQGETSCPDCGGRGAR